MLIELYGQNFGCFRDEFRLSMLATDVDPDTDRGIIEARIEGDSEPLRLLRAVAIYGPNASGKSTVLRAAGALRYLVSKTHRLRSDSPLRPYEPFALGSASKAPVRLGIKAVIDGRIYDYQVQFDRTKFVSEQLVRLKADGERVTLVDRVGQDVAGEWQDDERFALLTKDFRSNTLLLSLADILAPALAKQIAVGIRQLLTNFKGSSYAWFLEGGSSVAKRARDDADFSGWLLAHLRFADLGVVDLRTEEAKVAVRIHVGETQAAADKEIENDTRTAYRLSLMHSGEEGSFPIPYNRESGGTRRLIELAPLLYDLGHAKQPKAVFVDEIDESLHPVLLQGLIRRFNCEVPLAESRGQLIFVTHGTDLLDDEAKNAILRRDQIYLTEKDNSGAARLFSVADFCERNNLNLRRRYLQGRYGAVPSLGTFAE